jgi:hypothetical protein
MKITEAAFEPALTALEAAADAVAPGALPTKEALADAFIKAIASTVAAEQKRYLDFIEEHAQRYSRGSVTRVALDNLALEIRERS